jgi:hypothetical protein
VSKRLCRALITIGAELPIDMDKMVGPVVAETTCDAVLKVLSCYRDEVPKDSTIVISVRALIGFEAKPENDSLMCSEGWHDKLLEEARVFATRDITKGGR